MWSIIAEEVILGNLRSIRLELSGVHADQVCRLRYKIAIKVSCGSSTASESEISYV